VDLYSVSSWTHL